MPSVSAYIIAFNEEKNIANAVKSVQWAEEVVVADSYSTDGTADIARSLGARVVQVPFEGFGKLRNAAIAACSHDWIFSLDTDERCTESAQAEIRSIVESPEPLDAYYVPRRNILMGRWIRHSGFYPDFRQPQLFRRSALVFSDDMVHESFTVHGTTGFINSYIFQFPYRSFSQLLGKMERYSSLGAIKLHDRGKSVSMWKAFFHGIAAFFKLYILKRGFLDGWPGFVIALGNFEGTFWRYAKAVERQNSWDSDKV